MEVAARKKKKQLERKEWLHDNKAKKKNPPKTNTRWKRLCWQLP